MATYRDVANRAPLRQTDRMQSARNPELPAMYTRCDELSPEELDALPFGAIRLDLQGNILRYNRFESNLAGVRQGRAVGKNFFKDIAPCTDVQDFFGRFQRGVLRKELHEKFRYHFPFAKDPRDVMITLFYSDSTQSVWVFVQPVERSKP